MLGKSLCSTSLSLGTTTTGTTAPDYLDLIVLPLFSTLSGSVCSMLLEEPQCPTAVEKAEFTQEYFASMSDEELNSVLNEIAIIEEKEDVKQLKKL